MKNNLKLALVLSALFVCFQMFAPDSVFAQRRDHLSAEEIELIRDQQSIDGRMEIYIKAIDRRLMVLNNDTSTAKQIEKDSNTWGNLPTGTRPELLRDIEKILDESISKIDDVASHDSKNKLISVAVNILAEGATRFIPEFKLQLDKAASPQEKGSILNSIEHCNEIMEASVKVPKLTEKERKKIQKEVEKEIEKSQSPD